MLDTVGPELLIVNKSEQPISLQEDSLVILTPDQDKQASSNLLPINFGGLSKVKMLISCPLENSMLVYLVNIACDIYMIMHQAIPSYIIG